MYKPVVLLLFISITSIAGSVLPQHVINGNCKRFDPYINDCLLRRARELFPVFCKGIPELGIEPLEPMTVPEARFNENKGPINIVAKMTDVKLMGHSKGTITKFTFDPRTLSGQVTVLLPELLMRTLMDAKGSISITKVNTYATFYWKFTGLTFNFFYKLRPKMKNGVEYFTLDDLDLKSYAEMGYLQIKTLRKEDEDADQILASAFNSYPRAAMDALNDFMSRSSAVLYKGTFESILDKIPANEMLPQ